MRILFWSDIHLEFGKFKMKELSECDVIVIAGDLGVGLQGIDWIERNIPYNPVILVNGNHEYYGRDFDKHNENIRVRADKIKNLHLLTNETVYIGDIRFMGGTLWTDYNLYGNPIMSMLAAQEGLNDHRMITRGDRYFLPEDAKNEHEKTIKFLGTELNDPWGGRTVVVTHHAPSEQSICDTFKNDRTNPCYASNMEAMMMYNHIDLWFHGHMHHTVDYMVGDTRVLANPRGYVGHGVNSDFIPDCVVTI